MGWLVQTLLFFLARCTRNQLIRNIEYLKAENEMLRKRVPKQRIWLKSDEKDRLLELALAIGPDVKRLMTIVSYDTIRHWRLQRFGFTPKNRGRPKNPNDIRQLVIKLAEETVATCNAPLALAGS
jgi:putative transposase